MIGISVGLDFVFVGWIASVLHRHNYVNTQSKHEPIHLGRDIVPEEFWEHVTQTVDDLSPFGFKILGHFRKGDQVPGMVAFVTLLENKRQLDIATLLVVFVQMKKISQVNATLAISTEFKDGTKLVTGNTRILSQIPIPKNRLTLWLPNVSNAADLYRIHQQAVEGIGLGEKCWTLDGDPAHYMDELTQKELTRLVKLGYYKPDRTGDLLLLTWKGAILTAWKQLRPIKSIRRAWRKHQTNKLLRKLEE